MHSKSKVITTLTQNQLQQQKQQPQKDKQRQIVWHDKFLNQHLISNSQAHKL